MSRRFDIDWSFFLIVEFLESLKRSEISYENKTLLDIGSGAGIHSSIFRAFGLTVISIDKYSQTADIAAGYLDYKFDHQFDFIFCSHVIEHQRNPGLFLDKIYDDLHEHGLLLLSAPKHSASTLIEGHINCFKMPILIQHLVYSGFDLKSSSVLSVKGLENSIISKKDLSFESEERFHDAFRWSDEHQNRSFMPLESGRFIQDTNLFYNCSAFAVGMDSTIRLRNQVDTKKRGIEIISSRWNFSAVV